MSQFKKKIIILFLILGLNYVGLLTVAETLAYYNDEETSLENTFSAGTLDISLEPAGVYISSLMYPTDTTATSIILSNNGSLATQYKTQIIPLGSDTSACDYINLNSVKLLNFTSGP
ncbi:MAG: TasA family protein, partial [bacterium]